MRRGSRCLGGGGSEGMHLRWPLQTGPVKSRLAGVLGRGGGLRELRLSYGGKGALMRWALEVE